MPPRYTARPLPATAYLPGVSPRGDRPAVPPDRSVPDRSMIDAASLATSDELRYGVDLFNHGFPWEAHEVWEPLWFATPREHPERALLQGLIHAAAAAVKARTGATTIAHDFVDSACGYLERALSDLLDVRGLIAALRAWSHDVTAPPPTIILAEPPGA